MQHFPTSPDPGGLLCVGSNLIAKKLVLKGNFMKKSKALREKKEYRNVREMVEDIGEIFKGRVAYRYRVKPHDKEPVKVNYEVKCITNTRLSQIV